jgi:hypothetical protein
VITDTGPYLRYFAHHFAALTLRQVRRSETDLAALKAQAAR